MPAFHLEDLHHHFAEAFNAGDADALLSLYEPSAILLPMPGQVARGHEEIRKALGMFLGLKGKITIRTISVTQTDDVGLTHGEWSLTGTGPDGNPLTLGGKTAEVARRQSDGRWLYVIDNPNLE